MPPARRLPARVAPLNPSRGAFSRDASGPEPRTPTPTLTLLPLRPFPVRSTPNAQPLSLEELVEKREAEAKASARPSFVSKKDREAAALKRREAEVAARRDGASASAGRDGTSRPFPFREARADPASRGGAEARERDHDRRRDRRRADLGDDAFEARARERELELIRAQYMGGAKAQKRATKPSD